MNQNKKLIENMKNFEEKQGNPVEVYTKEMCDLAGTLENKRKFRNIINLLKPKQNGKRK